MKTRNRDNRSVRRALALFAALLVLAAIAVGAVLAYGKLRGLWIEQCVITDVGAQVTIETGSRIMPDTVREMFGLRNGANLALIDFATRREEALKKYPAIKSIGISRHLPNRVSVTVIERDPFARIGLTDSKKPTGRVCDEEGVVFTCRRGAETLPLIRERPTATPPGGRLEGRARSALALLLVAREPEFADLGILEIDTGKPDFLTITFTNYSSSRFLWTGMDAFTPESDAFLREQLKCQAKAVAANLSGDVKDWNATVQGLVTSSVVRPN